MTRRKKRKRTSQGQKSSEREPAIFNSPFNKLNSILKKERESPERPERHTSPPPDRTRDEEQYFLEAMSGVAPLPGRENIFTRTPNPDVRPAHPLKDHDLESLAHLSDLVRGNAEMDITFSDEYIEGSIQGINRTLMQRLKKGQFPIQDYTDLHGLTKAEAETKVRDFILQSYRLGLRCVLVIHGRGLNSANHIPVLKDRLPVWLNRGPVKKIILAFSTARPYDGGTGAIYVLLRKGTGGLKG